MNRSVLLLSCPDARGIVAAVSAWILEVGGNIVEADQHTDQAHGLFLQRICFDHEPEAAQLGPGIDALTRRWAMSVQLEPVGRPARLTLLVSREGHCLYDLLSRCADGDLDASVACVVSNHPDHEVTAARFGVPFHHVAVGEQGGEAARLEHEDRLAAVVAGAGGDLVVLARYMRVLTPGFVSRFGSTHLINIHHSFLPAFVGADPYRRAWERGVKLIGATAHYVTADLDEGPIIAQDVTHVSHRDTPETMTRRGRDLEAVVLARAVRAHLEHRIITYANRTVVFD